MNIYDDTDEMRELRAKLRADHEAELERMWELAADDETDDETDAETDASGVDTREKLEADVRSSIGFTTKDVIGWLDRQAAITTRECTKAYEDGCEACRAAQKRKIAELEADLNTAVMDNDSLRAENAELRDKLGMLKPAVERAEAERKDGYMRLPMDADGEPIHIGDNLESDEYGGKRFPCRGLSVEVGDSGLRWTVCMSYDKYSGTSEYTSASRCRHVKERTVEDVLRDAGVSVAAVSDVATEIRELMGGAE